MPIHDWPRVPSGLYHDFHQSWSVRVKDDLNAGRLPRGLSALVEQRYGVREADVQSQKEILAARANRIVVRHHLGDVVAVIEIVSPGNKDSRAALRDFVDKAVGFMQAKVHLLIIDPFPPLAARSAGHPRGDLGRGGRRAVRVPARQGPDAGVV